MGDARIRSSEISLFQASLPENNFALEEIPYIIALVRGTDVKALWEWEDCEYTRLALKNLQKRANEEMGNAQQLYQKLLERDMQFHLELGEESLNKEIIAKISESFDKGRANTTEVGPFKTTLCFKPVEEITLEARRDIVLHILILVTLRASVSFLITEMRNWSIPSYLMCGLVRLECPTCDLTRDEHERLRAIYAYDMRYAEGLPSVKRFKSTAPW